MRDRRPWKSGGLASLPLCPGGAILNFALDQDAREDRDGTFSGGAAWDPAGGAVREGRGFQSLAYEVAKVTMTPNDSRLPRNHVV